MQSTDYATPHSLPGRMLSLLVAALLLLPMMAFAGGRLLDERDLARAIKQEADYQLLDARSAGARQLAPLAFSKRYEKDMQIDRGMVFVVADSDEEALAVARSIPAATDRRVFAVKGGADAWKSAQSELPSVIAPTGFVVPKGTCDLGKPALTFDAETKGKPGKAVLEPINK